MDKEKNAYIVEYYSTIKKMEILLFATTWVDPEGIMLSEIGQKEKKIRWILYKFQVVSHGDITYSMVALVNNTALLI